MDYLCLNTFYLEHAYSKKQKGQKQIMQKINELTIGNVNKKDFQRGDDSGEDATY